MAPARSPSPGKGIWLLSGVSWVAITGESTISWPEFCQMSGLAWENIV